MNNFPTMLILSYAKQLAALFVVHFLIVGSAVAQDPCAPDELPPIIDITNALPLPGPYTCAEFNAGIPAGPDLPFEDACDAAANGMATPVDDASGVDECLGGTVVRTWMTTVDASGNQGTFTQMITILPDAASPTFVEAAGALDVTVDCDDEGALDTAVGTMPTAMDDCSSVNLAMFSDNTLAGDCDASYERRIVWRATDDCGNTADYVVAITVEDTSAPVWDAVTPLVVPIECTEDITSVVNDNVPTASDNCTTPTVTLVSDELSNEVCEGNYTRTLCYITFDECDNENIDTFKVIINVSDTEYPEWGTPMIPLSDALVNCTGNVDSVIIANVPEAEDDNCSSSFVELVSDELSAGVAVCYLRTLRYILRDSCGNENPDTMDIEIAIEDTAAPIWDAVSPLALSADCVDDIDALISDNIPTATDDCSGAEISEVDDDVVDGTCDGNYTRTIAYIAADSCGNQNADTFRVVITVVDTVAPVFQMTAGSLDSTFSCTDLAGINTLAATVPAADDACSPMDAARVVLLSDDIVDGTCDGEYTRTLIYQANDSCQNIATYEIVITVIDTIPPGFMELAGALDMEFDCSDPDAADVLTTPPTPTVMADGCSGEELFIVRDTTIEECQYQYDRIITYGVRDNCDNENTATYDVTISIIDTIAPTIDNGSMVVVGPFNCDELPIDVGMALPATDDCDTSVQFTALPVDNYDGLDACAGGTFIRTWTVTDVCGNMNRVQQMISVNADTTPPTWVTSSPVNLSANCGEDLTTLTNDNIPTATDNCTDGDEIVVTQVSSTDDSSTSCGATFIRTIQYVVEDACGNENPDTVEVIITVVDTIAPVWNTTSPNELDTYCGDDIDAFIGLNIPTATDACGGTVTVTEVADDDAEGSCSGELIRTIRYVVMDACNNENPDTFDLVLTILDTIPPVIDNGAMVAVGPYDCNDLIPAGSPLPASDSCDPLVSMTAAPTDDASGVDDCTGGTIIRTWVVADGCGNQNQVQQMITVLPDMQGPDWDTTVTTINIDTTCSADVDAIVALYVPTASDSCNNATVRIVNDNVVNTCTDEFERQVFYVAEDDCDNVTTDTFKLFITVVDTVAPSLVGVPLDTLVDCGSIPEVPAEGVITSTDNCDDEVAISFAETTTVGVCPTISTIERTWTATDNCGRATVLTQTITVQDTTAPTLLNIPIDLDLTCEDAIPVAPIDVTATDACDTDVPVIFAETTIPGACATISTIERVWTATDDCGNMVTDTQFINIIDPAPVVSCQNISIDLDGAGMASIEVNDILTASSDVCGGTFTHELSQTDFDCSDVGDNMIELITTDNCGNMDTCEATVTVNSAAICNAELSIAEPCACKNNATTLTNGQFDEIIEISGPTGQDWEVTAVTGLYLSTSAAPPTAPTLIPIGTGFVETPPNSGTYILNGIHIDAEGYTIAVSNGFQTLDTFNTCYYPDPVITGLDGPYCAGSPVITLAGNADTIPGMGSFTIDGNAAIEFDAAALGVGSYDVVFTFDADVVNPNSPGCIQSVEQTVQVVETSAQLACNDTLIVSPDENCMLVVTPDIVLEGSILCEDDYSINLILNGVDTGTDTVDMSFVGQMVIAVVMHVPSNTTNNCEAVLMIEDNFPPMITACENDTISCNTSIDPDDLGRPTAMDNCSELSFEYVDTVEDLDCSNGDFLKRITRAWTVKDTSDNEASCTQIIMIRKAVLTDIVFPADIDGTLSCPNPDTTTANTGVPLLNGQELATNAACPLTAIYQDVFPIPICENSYKFLRAWTVLDECTNAIVRDTQLIKVMDDVEPTIDCPTNYEVNVDANSCVANIVLPEATVSDLCSSTANITVTIEGPDGPIIGNNATNLAIGVHSFEYTATDDCGNTSTCTLEVTVVDDIVPTVACDEHTVVSVIASTTNVNASVFDDGSSDNCGTVSFDARRMDGTNCSGNNDATFGETVPFYCCDVGNTVMIELRVTDEAGNTNSCMVEANIQDKLNPAILCPQPIEIECTDDYTDLSITGEPTTADNCGIDTVFYADTPNLNSCGTGTLSRRWTTIDVNGRTGSCTQLITLVNNNPFAESDITWPTNYEDNNRCSVLSLEPENLPVANREPILNSDACDNVVMSHSDLVFNIEGEACFKILRTWLVIDWCQYHPVNNPNVGRYEYTQVLKMLNTNAPVIASTCADTVICNFATDCNGGTAQLNLSATDDCTPTIDLDFSYEIDLDNDGTVDRNGTSSSADDTYPIGTHRINWAVSDGCGNTSNCSYLFEMKDCKAPVAYCYDGLAVEIMPNAGMIEVPISMFNAGSFDNCTANADLQFSYSSDVTETTRIYDCDSLGTRSVEMWVTDANGNQASCIVTLNVQNNMNGCLPLGSIAGYIATESADMVDDVTLDLSGGTMPPFITNEDGSYTFPNLPINENYIITPEKDIDHRNGISTVDVLMTQRHALGIQLLDSPYKMIAADVNASGTITGLDIAEMRKIILFIQDEFQNNTSWRFVTNDYLFPLSEDPLTTDFPEVYSVNNLSGNMAYADFVGVKIGDVNGSAIANSAIASQVRETKGDLLISVKDQLLKAGQEYKVTFDASDLNTLLGYQYTLAFDKEKLTFVDVASTQLEGLETTNFGLSLLDEGFITTSWANYNSAILEEEKMALFSLTFRAEVDAKLSDILTINSRYTKAEAYQQITSHDFDLLNVALAFETENGIETSKSIFDLHQNRPNPFKESTMISFDLPSASSAILTIYDVSGKVLKRIEGDFQKGYNEVNIKSTDFSTTGILYYQLETPTHTATRKMILLD